jgi:deoxyribonuclease-4
MSVAGGVSRAVDRAELHGCEALQIFAKNANRWVGGPLDPAEVRRFRRRLDETGIAPAVSHASYLINLASAFQPLREQSIAAFVDELDRAHALGLLGVVVHPGACTSGSDGDALRLVADGVRRAFRARPRIKTMVLFELTAGQGRSVGHRFEQVAGMLEHLDGSPRAGVCVDTCHLVAAGYDIVTEVGYQQTLAAFEKLIGFDRLRVIHGNDSKRPCGSRVDRHEHIGQGCLGLEPFRRLFADGRLRDVPILIETEKTPDLHKPGSIVADPLDVMNLETLRRLRSSVSAQPRARAEARP